MSPKQASEHWKRTNISNLPDKRQNSSKIFQNGGKFPKKTFVLIFQSKNFLQQPEYYEAEMPFHRDLYQKYENR